LLKAIESYSTREEKNPECLESVKWFCSFDIAAKIHPIELKLGLVIVRVGRSWLKKKLLQSVIGLLRYCSAKTTTAVFETPAWTGAHEDISAGVLHRELVLDQNLIVSAELGLFK
jgi:hypothetical protein